MYIRFHRGLAADAVIPTSAGYQPDGAPGDVVWNISTDINPSKTIQVTQNVQATDPITGAPLNENGMPVWKTTNALDTQGKPIPVIGPDGKPEIDAQGNPVYQQQIVTQQVSQVVYLNQAPQYFTPADIQTAITNAGATYTVAGSINDAKAAKVLELKQAYAQVLAAGFTSSADGTNRTYGFAQADIDNLNEEQSTINASLETFPVEWADKGGNPVALSSTQWTQLAKDARAFKWSQVNHLRQQIATAEGASTTTAVDAVTW